jgi:hypothetical protein
MPKLVILIQIEDILPFGAFSKFRSIFPSIAVSAKKIWADDRTNKFQNIVKVSRPSD